MHSTIGETHLPRSIETFGQNRVGIHSNETFTLVFPATNENAALPRSKKSRKQYISVCLLYACVYHEQLLLQLRVVFAINIGPLTAY